MKRGFWPIATAFVLAIFAATQGFALRWFGPGLEPASHVFAAGTLIIPIVAFLSYRSLSQRS
ncbi:MAG: hypothetical protein V3U30_03580 [Thermoplasmata archaeon]